MFSIDDYVLQLMKIKNPVFQNIRIIHKTNKKELLIQKCQHLERYDHLCTQYSVRAAFAPITVSMQRSMKWHC